MKTKLILTILLGIILLAGVTAISFSDVTKDDFKDKLTKLDTKTICNKEKEIKPFIQNKVLGTTYQDLKCEKDYLLKPEKLIDTNLIKQNKQGWIMIKNE